MPRLSALPRNLLRSCGFDLIRYHHTSSVHARRMRLLEYHGITLVLDVGANTGQYASLLRRDGYRNRIVSFEPLSSAYRELQAAAAGDPEWKTVRLALGDKEGSARLNVAANSQSSSLLGMLPAHSHSAPDSAYVGSEEVPVRRLDGIFGEYGRPGDRTYLKIDAQGFEKNILDGSKGCLDRILGIQLEMSLLPLYEGEELMPGIVALLAGLGFSLMAVEPGWSDPETGRLLQMDGIFYRESSP